MSEKIKVLIADDAAFMRKTIRKILEKDPRFVGNRHRQKRTRSHQNEQRIGAGCRYS